jgi:hypothetical protein
MTTAQLGALIRGLVPALRDYIAAALTPVHDRLTALETQERIPGEQGPAGPAGKDGAPGRDGTFDSISMKQLDERTWCFVRADGTPIPGTFRTPSVLDRGVYRAGHAYEKGDGVTFGGSFWIAQDATSEKPGDGATKWRLAVKAGREGREGKPGPEGPRGPAGANGAPGRNYA